MAKTTVKLSEELDQLLSNLASKGDSTKAEIIHRSILVYDYLTNEIENGYKISITGKDGETVREIVWF